MFTALSRVIKYGFLGFWRNGWLSTTTISILIITLTVFEGLIIFREITGTALNSLQDKIDISVYFKSDTPEDEILKAKTMLGSLSEVKEVQYISKDRALEIFQVRHIEDETISQSIRELQGNPLLPSLNIKANDPKQYVIISDYLKNASFKDYFQKVTYAQNAVVIERLNRIIDTSENGGYILTIILAVIAVMVTFNTIRLAIYSSREEIGIMRLVGASNWFIRGPYMVEGIIYGCIAAILRMIIIAPAIYFVSPYIKIFIPEMNTWGYLTSHIIKLSAYQLLFGVVLGVISSAIAVRKYLKI